MNRRQFLSSVIAGILATNVPSFAQQTMVRPAIITVDDVVNPKGSWPGACKDFTREMLQEWIGEGITPAYYAIKPIDHPLCTPYARLYRLLQTDIFTEQEIMLVYLCFAKRRAPAAASTKITQLAKYVIGQYTQTQANTAVSAYLPDGMTLAQARNCTVEKFKNLVGQGILDRYKAGAIAVVCKTGADRMDFLRRGFYHVFNDEDCLLVSHILDGTTTLQAELGI